MTQKTKKTLITLGVILGSIVIIRKVRQNRMISDEKSGIFGLGILGIL